MIHRLISTPLPPLSFHTELDTDEQIARVIGLKIYPQEIVYKKIISRTWDTTSSLSRTKPEKRWLRMSYLGAVTRELLPILRKANISLSTI